MEFTPAVYEHAAALIGRRPWEVSRDAELLARAHAEAYRRYRHAPVVPGIDIYTLEAEAYGAEVADPGGEAIPAVTRHPCGDLEAIRALEPFDPETDGRLPMMLEAAARLRGTLPQAEVRVPLAGPFSIAANLVGLETLLCELQDDPEAAAGALRHLAAGQEALARAAAARGLGVAFFESAAAPPLLSPELFRRVELPALRETIRRAAGAPGGGVPCIIGGDTAPVLEEILSTGTRCVICPSETDQAAFMAGLRERTGVRVRINMDPGIIASGDAARIAGEVDRVRALAAGRANTCLGTGVLPYETPPGAVETVRRILAEREARTATH
jgi:uroporphyrinogen decarboxylase